jgi:hypothetical protein
VKTWIDLDEHGRQRLTRQGWGRVTAVTPAGDGDFRVEIDVDLPRSLTRAVRFTAQAVLASGHPLFDEACAASAWGQQVIWAIEWVPLEGVPESVPIESLDLAREARARLVSLVCIPAVTDPVQARMSGELP